MSIRSRSAQRRDNFLREIRNVENMVFVLLFPTRAAVVLSLNHFMGEQISPQARFVAHRTALNIDLRLLRMVRLRHSYNIAQLNTSSLRRYLQFLTDTMYILRNFREFEHDLAFPRQRRGSI